MDEKPGDWPPPPDADITVPVVPAQNLQKWLALALSLVGSIFFFALITAAPAIWSISESLWTGMYYGFQWCLLIGFVLGARTYRHWQGMIAMLLSLTCTAILIYILFKYPLNH